ncbi:MAG: hypothetical protein LBQ71_04700 [Hungatella sp.]|jgi:hypothetical protein|nr:hypothetical protein [Hungatella sp.]
MGFSVKITGSENIELCDTNITNVVFEATIPYYYARSTDLRLTAKRQAVCSFIAEY